MNTLVPFTPLNDSIFFHDRIDLKKAPDNEFPNHHAFLNDHWKSHYEILLQLFMNLSDRFLMTATVFTL